MNQVRASLKVVFGNQLPEGTTSFHTYAQENLHLACFLIGKTGKFVDVEMTADQVAALKQRKLLGSLGWQLQ